MPFKKGRDYFGPIEPEDPEIEYERPRHRNYVGCRFERWLIIEKLGTYIYVMRCDCGREFNRQIWAVLNNNSSQCKECYKKVRKYKPVKGMM